MKYFEITWPFRMNVFEDNSDMLAYDCYFSSVFFFQTMLFYGKCIPKVFSGVMMNVDAK